MKKRKIYKVHPYRKYIIFVLLFFLFVGIGFSLLVEDLNILGSVQLKKYEETTLYNVHKLTIHYIVRYDPECEEQYADDYIGYYTEGEEFSVESPYSDGYDISEFVIEGTMGNEDLEYTVYYDMYTPTLYFLTINYYYEGEDEPFDVYDEWYLYSDHYFVESPNIEGYYPDISVVEGEIEDDITIDVYYSPIDENSTY